MFLQNFLTKRLYLRKIYDIINSITTYDYVSKKKKNRGVL